MSLLGKILKTAIDVTTSPIDIVKDAVTMGGLLTDKEKSYTKKKLKKLGNDLEEMQDEVDKL